MVSSSVFSRRGVRLGYPKKKEFNYKRTNLRRKWNSLALLPNYRKRLPSLLPNNRFVALFTLRPAVLPHTCTQYLETLHDLVAERYVRPCAPLHICAHNARENPRGHCSRLRLCTFNLFETNVCPTFRTNFHRYSMIMTRMRKRALTFSNNFVSIKLRSMCFLKTWNSFAVWFCCVHVCLILFRRSNQEKEKEKVCAIIVVWVTSLDHITSRHVITSTSHHITSISDSYHITSHHIWFTSHHLPSHMIHITSPPITSHHIASHHVTAHHTPQSSHITSARKKKCFSTLFQFEKKKSFSTTNRFQKLRLNENWRKLGI
jgi:hypothetical protein